MLKRICFVLAVVFLASCASRMPPVDKNQKYALVVARDGMLQMDFLTGPVCQNAVELMVKNEFYSSYQISCSSDDVSKKLPYKVFLDTGAKFRALSVVHASSKELCKFFVDDLIKNGEKTGYEFHDRCDP